MLPGESFLDYTRRMKSLNRGVGASMLTGAQPTTNRVSMQPDKSPLDVYRRENLATRVERGDESVRLPVNAAKSTGDPLGRNESSLNFYRRINQAEQAQRALRSEQPVSAPISEPSTSPPEVQPGVVPEEQLTQDNHRGASISEMMKSQWLNSEQSSEGQRSDRVEDNERDASIREMMRSPWLSGGQSSEVRQLEQGDRVEDAEVGELDPIDRAADKLESQLNASGDIQWKVEAGTTTTGYGIKITDSDTGRVLQLASLLKNPAAIEAYKELLGTLELAAMEKQQFQPGEFKRVVEVASSVSQVRDVLPAEQSFFKSLWSRAAEKQEPKPVTEQKESKLKALFDRGRSVLSGLRERTKGWFARERATMPPVEAIPPSAPEVMPLAGVARERVAEPMLGVETRQSRAEVVAAISEGLDEGEKIVEAIFDKPARAPEAVRELTAKARELQTQADKLTRRLEVKGMSGNERKKVEKLLQSTMTRLRAEIDGKVA